MVQQNFLYVFLIIVLLLILNSSLQAYQLTTVYNPYTGKLDYINKLDKTVQITIGSLMLYDSNGCLWDFTAGTGGSFQSMLISCPGTPSAPTSCVTGTPIGLLLSIVCP